MYDQMLAMLSLTKMDFDPLRGLAFPRLDCLPMLRAL